MSSSMRCRCALLLPTLTLALLAPKPLFAAITGTTQVGFVEDAVFATHAPGDPNRLFVVERNQSIRIIDLQTQTTLATPFLSVPDVDNAGEGGLLGLAFHPDYQTNGKFYVYVTVDNGGQAIDGVVSPFSSHVREYTVSANPNVADSNSKKEVLSWLQPRSNHNGGWIGFSPNDNQLYIASGDGGKQGDPDGNAQDITDEPLGKVLRINVDGDDFPTDPLRNYAIPANNPFVGVAGDDEIWAYGLRNPWRASFDRATGDFWIGDVGQGSYEEINLQPGDSVGGENYAWNRLEGASPYQGGQSQPGDADPIYVYSHGAGAFQGNSVVGGYVYRGADPDLRGNYYFLDSISDNVWSRTLVDGLNLVQKINGQLGVSDGFRVSFGEDADGNLYMVDLGGAILRIDTDIMLAGDYNGDRSVDSADYDFWRSQFGQTGLNAADGNGDQVVDAADYALWRNNLGRSLPGAGTAFAAAPEPATLALAAWFLALVPRQRRHRDRAASEGVLQCRPIIIPAAC